MVCICGYSCVEWLTPADYDDPGVLWSGDHVFEGVPETLLLLRSKGEFYCHEEPIDTRVSQTL